MAKGKSILAIDVGGGTQDILIYERGKPLESCIKLILPAPTVIIANKIRKITKEKRPLFLRGNLMGGGACVAAIREHLKQGLKVYATELAAKTIRDNLEVVKRMGVEIVREAPLEAASIWLRDIDLSALEQALAHFDVEIPRNYAIAVQDHGECLEGSNRQFRFAQWKKFIEEGGELSRLAYFDVPLHLTRMRAIKEDLPGAILMDTGAAALWGALCDPLAAVKSDEGLVIVNIGNQHVIGALVQKRRLWGLFEHHTWQMDSKRLKEHIHRLRNATLSNEEVFSSGGHGCFIHPNFPRGDGFSFVTVTGPKRSLSEGLGYYFAVPYGDIMLVGCFGLIAAALELDF